MKRLLAFGILSITLLAAASCNDQPTAPRAPRMAPLQGALAAVMRIQDRHTPQLLQVPGVVGTATGIDPSGHAVVFVLTTSTDVTGIPGVLENVPVNVRVTGEIRALAATLAPPGGGKRTNLKSLIRPVPNGVSVGNNLECAAGTLGTGLIIGGQRYVLSNNHVFARQNAAAIGEVEVQPGRYGRQPQCAGNNPTGTTRP